MHKVVKNKSKVLPVAEIKKKDDSAESIVNINPEEDNPEDDDVIDEIETGKKKIAKQAFGGLMKEKSNQDLILEKNWKFGAGHKRKKEKFTNVGDVLIEIEPKKIADTREVTLNAVPRGDISTYTSVKNQLTKEYKAIEAIINKAQFWEDPDFPPCSESLFHDWDDVPDQGLWENIKWRRAIDFLKEDDNPEEKDTPVMVFDGDISPSDCVQGALGNCYFVCAMSVLAEYGNRIKEVFQTDDKNDAGIYSMLFYHDGKPMHVIVNDELPCMDATSGPIFARAKGNEMWAILLEKAWAKLHGGYQAIISGRASEVLSDLTGAPSDIHSVADEKQLFEIMLKADENRFCIAASVPDIAEVNLKDEVGLVEEHTYGVIRAVQIQEDIQLVQLRNPWSRNEWKGDWSDESDLWTPELRQKLNQTSGDDGTFWMEYNDFKLYFESVVILRYRDNWCYAWQEILMQPGATQAVQLKISKTTTVCISLKQETIDQREDSTADSYFQNRMSILQLTPNLKCIKQTSKSNHRDNNVELLLIPGDYLIIPEVSVKKPTNVVISAYSEKEVELSLDSRDKAALTNVYSAALREKVLKKGKCVNWSEDDAAGIKTYSYQFPGGCALLYQNGEKHMQIKERLLFQLSNCEVVAVESSSSQSWHFQNELGVPSKVLAGDELWVEVDPGEYTLILIKSCGMGTFTYGYATARSICWVLDKFSVQKLKSLALTSGERSNMRKQGNGMITMRKLIFDNGFFFLLENPSDSNSELDYRFQLVEDATENIQLYGRPAGIQHQKVVLRPGDSGFVCGYAPAGRWSYSYISNICITNNDIEYHSDNDDPPEEKPDLYSTELKVKTLK